MGLIFFTKQRAWIAGMILGIVGCFPAIGLCDTGTTTSAQLGLVTRQHSSQNNRIQITSLGSTETVTISASAPDGNPLVGMTITPEVISQPEGVTMPMEFTPTSGKTNVRGEARFEVLPGNKSGRYSVVFFHRDEHGTEGFTPFEFVVQEANWPTSLILSLAGGLALFLYGMKLAADGLQSSAGHRLRNALTDLTRNRFSALLVGIVATFLTQSSGATIVMLMSFVRSKLLSFRQSLGIILGAAVGTTLTVQLISFNLFAYALPAVAVGFFVYFISKRPKAQSFGMALLGFGLIFFGMKVMSDQIAPLKVFPFFRDVIQAVGEHPVWATILSAVFTAGVYSSGATLAIVLALARQDLISLQAAVPIILGAGIGTCFLGITASVGAPVDAKRIAWAHLIFKIVTVLVALPFLGVIVWAGLRFTELLHGGRPFDPGQLAARGIANTYTLVYTAAALCALPFIQYLERLSVRLIPSPPEYLNGGVRPKYLDLQILDTPSIALGSVRREISRMGRFVEEMMKYIIVALLEKDEKVLDFIRQRDNKVDCLETEITHYLTNLTKRTKNDSDSERAMSMLYIVSDMESIGDIIDKNLVPAAEKMIVQELQFSDEGRSDLLMLHQKVSEHLSEMVIALATSDRELIEPVIAGFANLQEEGKRLHLRHLQRLQNGLRESIETSSVHLDVINYLLRIDYLIFNISLHIAGKVKSPSVIDVNAPAS